MTRQTFLRNLKKVAQKSKFYKRHGYLVRQRKKFGDDTICPISSVCNFKYGTTYHSMDYSEAAIRLQLSEEDITEIVHASDCEINSSLRKAILRAVEL